LSEGRAVSQEVDTNYGEYVMRCWNGLDWPPRTVSSDSHRVFSSNLGGLVLSRDGGIHVVISIIVLTSRNLSFTNIRYHFIIVTYIMSDIPEANNPPETIVCSEFQTILDPPVFSEISSKLPGALGVVGESGNAASAVSGLAGGTFAELRSGFLAGFSRAARSSSVKTDTVVS
jgi:hypothetical protein